MKAPLPKNEAARVEALYGDLERITVERKQAQKQRQRFFTRIATGFGLASAILVVLGVVLYRNLTGIVETSNQAAQSHKVFEKLEAVLSHMKNAETGQRGYVTTGEEPLLEPYHAAIEIVDQEVKNLRRLTAANPNQQRQIDTLEVLIAQRLAINKQIIDLRKNKGSEAVKQVVLTGKGKNLMNDIRACIREIENEENKLLTRASLSTEANVRNTIFTFSNGIFLTFFILSGVYYFIYHESTERKRTEAALQQERDFTSAILDTVSALVIVLDPQGRIVRFNQACQQTTGYLFDEVRGKYVWDLFLMSEKVEVQTTFEKLLTLPFGFSYEVRGRSVDFREASAKEIGETCQIANQHENYWVMRNGDRRLIAWSNTLLYNKVGAVEYVVSSGIDITERQQVEEQVHFLQTLMLAISETQDFESALAVILRTVCENKGWNYGEAWIPCLDKTVLTCSPAWYSTADGSGHTFPVLEKFRRLSEELTFGLNIGLPGRVWSSKQPEWQEDVSRESQINFRRAHIAMECGLRAGMGIPLIVNEQVLAVLVFFKFESSKEDMRLVESISAVATQLGSVIQRQRMQEVLRESEERFKVFMTESQQAEAALQDTTTLQRAILDSANYTIISTTVDGTIRTFNTAAERWLGYAAQEVVGKTTLAFHDSDEVVRRAQELYTEMGVRITFAQYLLTPGFEVIVAKARRGEPDEREWSYIRKDGSRFPVLLSVTALRDAKDNITGFLAVGSDITERQRAEKALLESQTRLSLVNSISIGITSGISVAQVIERTVKQISRYFNTLRVVYSIIDEQDILSVLHSIEPPGMVQLTGKVINLTAAPEYLNALCVSGPVIVEDVATDNRLAPLVDAISASGTQAILNVPLEHSEQLVGLLSFEEPKPRQWSEYEIVTLIEVAYYLSIAIKEANAQQERQRAEEELREMSVALENAVEGISQLDTQGCYINVNKAYASMVGYKPEEMIGMEWQATIHPEEREKMMVAYQYMLTNGKVETEARAVRKDGSVFYKQLMMVSNYDKRQKFIGHYCFTKNITERKRTEAARQQANEKLTGWVNELEQRNREIALLGEIGDLLQACLTVEEAYTAIAKLLQPLFPETSGGIFLITASKNLVEAVVTWGNLPFASQQMFTPDECWALRRGQAHWVDDLHGGLVCKHIHDDKLPTESLCVPMMAQGEAMGVLYLSSLELGRLTETKQQLAVTVSEQIALSLANLKLRETLQNQSVRDPLTGLFNRRYLEASLEREINRAQRKQQSLGIIMLDVDHFKRFNDTFGHEAGDVMLRELGHFLQKHIRGSDIACRYGGEELTLILPEASLEVTHQRAEQLREGIKHLQVQHRYQPLGAITLSLGVACYPLHGITSEAVMQAADAALYRAKQGRDAVRLASSSYE